MKLRMRRIGTSHKGGGKKGIIGILHQVLVWAKLTADRGRPKKERMLLAQTSGGINCEVA